MELAKISSRRISRRETPLPSKPHTDDRERASEKRGYFDFFKNQKNYNPTAYLGEDVSL
jgi:hypothetical protein